MAGRGPAPKGQRSRERDQRRVSAATIVLNDDGETRGPELPDGDWPDQTRRWWHTWRTSPQAQLFEDTDWSFLLDTALLHAAFIMGEVKLGAELRLRVGKLGATPEDRARLHVTIATTPVEPMRETDQPGRRDRRARLAIVVAQPDDSPVS